METGDEAEFYASLSIYGGILFVGVTISLILFGFAMLYKAKMKKKGIIKELYNEKERKNGQEKGGAQGHY